MYVEWISDGYGNNIKYERDRKGLKSIQESSGRRIDVKSENGLIKEMYLAEGSESKLLVSYAYSKDGELLGVTDAESKIYKFYYKNRVMI